MSVRLFVLPATMPAQGEPVSRVWLPQSRKLSDLEAEVRLSDTGSFAARRKAEALGLTVVRIVGGLPNNQVLWVAWVQPGEKPQGYIELPVADALAAPAFTVLVRALQAAMSRR